MKLLIKQRVFSWIDTYDVYDESGNVKYFVKAEFLSIGHRIHVYDTENQEVGMIKEKVITLLPVFEIEGAGIRGRIEKKLSFLKPKYQVDFNGWQIKGDFLAWNYEVTDKRGEAAARITKEPLHWGDTYVIDYQDPADELMTLLLVIAIDAANCSGEG